MQKSPPPIISREAYTQRAIESAWPSGSWVEDQDPAEGVVSSQDEERLAPSLTVIGDTKDEAALEQHLIGFGPSGVILGRLKSGRGAESKIAQVAERLGLEVSVVEVDQDRFGLKAESVHVEQVLVQDINSPLLIVGDGTRAKQAKAWVKRANWPREVTYL